MKAFTVFSTQALTESFESYQSFLYRQDQKKFLSLIEKSYNLFSKNGPDKTPFILTDSLGKQKILDHTGIQPANILDVLNKIEKKYWQIWSLPKILGIQYILTKYDKFIYFNYDILLKEKIPNDFLNKKVFVYKEESHKSAKDWGYTKYIDFIKLNQHVEENRLFYEKCKNLDFEKDELFFNTDILGGNYIKFIKNYLDTAIGSILNEINSSFWVNDQSINNNYGKACILDQFIFGVMAHAEKLKVSCLSEYSINDSNVNIIGKEKVYYFN